MQMSLVAAIVGVKRRRYSQRERLHRLCINRVILGAAWGGDGADFVEVGTEDDGWCDDNTRTSGVKTAAGDGLIAVFSVVCGCFCVSEGAIFCNLVAFLFRPISAAFGDFVYCCTRGYGR